MSTGTEEGVAAELEEFGESQGKEIVEKGKSFKGNIDLLKDVPVTLAVEVGRTKIHIRDLLNLQHGSVVKLSRQVGESLDVCVNGILVARGDVVVAEDTLGIRLTEVISPEKRAEMLK